MAVQASCRGDPASGRGVPASCRVDPASGRGELRLEWGGLRRPGASCRGDPASGRGELRLERRPTASCRGELRLERRPGAGGGRKIGEICQYLVDFS